MPDSLVLSTTVTSTPGKDYEAMNGSAVTTPANWYALAVKHQHERALAACLREKGFEALAPTYRSRRQWSDRIKEAELPLFPGYLFCRFELCERLRVLDTPGISRIVGFAGRPVPVSEAEIGAIRAVLQAGMGPRPWPYLKPGDRVRIDRGPLRGIEGALIREKDALRLVIGVELLQRSIAVEVGAESITPMRGPSKALWNQPPGMAAAAARAAG